MKNKKIQNKIAFLLIGTILLIGIASMVYSAEENDIYPWDYSGHSSGEITPGTFAGLKTDVFYFAGKLGLGEFTTAELPECSSNLLGKIGYNTDLNSPVVCTNDCGNWTWKSIFEN